MFRFTTLTFFALAATFVAAQDISTSAATPNPSGINTCVADCILTGALAARCTSATDYVCFCKSAVFQTSFETCIQKGCPDQLALATAAKQEVCAEVFISSGAPSGAPSTSTTSPRRSGAAFKNAPVAGAMGALAALVGAAIF